MNVELSRVKAPMAPAVAMMNPVVEHTTALMVVFGGIESISSMKYQTGFGDRLHVSISQFEDAPNEIREQGIVIKDALAQILSVVNVTKVVAKPSEEDMKNIRDAWKGMIDAVKNQRDEANGIPMEIKVEDADTKEKPEAK